MGFTPLPPHVCPEIHSGASDVRYPVRFHLQEVDLSGDAVIVGRGATCQITIDDPMLSRRHARLDLRGSEPEIEDLGSRNGTQLDGSPLRGRAVLRDGDRIRLGTRELVFLVPTSARQERAALRAGGFGTWTRGRGRRASTPSRPARGLPADEARTARTRRRRRSVR